MRILTLVAGPEALADANRLGAEIRAFNVEIDFRLRFLHIDIEQALVAAAAVAAELSKSDVSRVHSLTTASPLAAAAALALLLERERPALLVVVGAGSLMEAGLAAAEVAGTRVGLFGEHSRAQPGDPGVLDLGNDPRLAVERVSGVARELG